METAGICVHATNSYRLLSVVERTFQRVQNGAS